MSYSAREQLRSLAKEIDDTQDLSELKNILKNHQPTHQQLFNLIKCTSSTSKKSLLIIQLINSIEHDDEVSQLLNDIESTYPDHQLLQKNHEEYCLIFAMGLLRNNPMKHSLYLAYINLLTDKLLNNHYPLSQQTLELLSHLMLQNELTPSNKETLFSSLLAYQPQDEKIRYAMIKYNITRVIQSIETSYQQVINLCEWSLETLDHQEAKETIKIAQKALEEAQFELELSQNTGYFSSLWGRLKRCWTYGWTGFLKPNNPTYVKFGCIDLAFEDQEQKINIAIPHINVEAPYSSSKQFDAFVKTAMMYSLDKQLINWQTSHLNPSLANRFHLIERMLEPEFYPTINKRLNPAAADEEYNAVLEQPISEETPHTIHNPPPIDFSKTKSSLSPHDELEDFLKASAEEYKHNVQQHEQAQQLLNYATEYAGYAYNTFSETANWASHLFFSATNLKQILPFNAEVTETDSQNKSNCL